MPLPAAALRQPCASCRPCWPDAPLLAELTSRLLLVHISIREPVLKFDVPELVDGAYLAENPSLMSIDEERDERPWQPVAHSKAYSSDRI